MWQAGCQLTGSKVGDWHPCVFNVSHICTRMRPNMAACKHKLHLEFIGKQYFSASHVLQGMQPLLQ